MAHRVCQGWHISTYDSCHNRPSEAHFLGSAISKLRFRLRLSLAWSFSQYAISDGGISGYRGHLYKFFVGEMFLCLRWGKKIRRGATFDVFVLWRKRMGGCASWYVVKRCLTSIFRMGGRRECLDRNLGVLPGRRLQQDAVLQEYQPGRLPVVVREQRPPHRQ